MHAAEMCRLDMSVTALRHGFHTAERSTGESSGGDSAPRIRSCVLRLVRGGLPLWLLPALPALPLRRLAGPLSLSEALEVSEAPRSSGTPFPSTCRAVVGARAGRVSSELPAEARSLDLQNRPA
jgi:hypothetical protein